MDTLLSNPVARLLEQAMILIESSKPVAVVVDYEAITKAAIHAVKEERKRILEDLRTLVTQSEAHNMYGKSVITDDQTERGSLSYHKTEKSRVQL